MATDAQDKIKQLCERIKVMDVGQITDVRGAGGVWREMKEPMHTLGLRSLVSDLEAKERALEKVLYYIEECPKDLQPCDCNSCEAFRIATAALGGGE